MIENDDSSTIEIALLEGRYPDAESECRQFIAQHEDHGRPVDIMVLSWMKSLARALEAQGKFSEGLDTRLRARLMLVTLMDLA